MRKEEPEYAKCPFCGKEFRKGDFGVGYKYCSSKCRHLNGRKPGANYYTKPGRPRRFPQVNAAARLLVMDMLKEHGWQLWPYTNEHPTRMFGRKGLWLVRLNIGGHQKDYNWAQVTVYPNLEISDYLVESTCSKIKDSWAVDDKRGGFVVKKKRRACGDEKMCRKCRMAALMQSVREVNT